jgi:hypothetical protein
MIPRFVLIIGAMKSGTTTLYDYLRTHPQIATGPNKEPGFFAFEETWELGFEWYETQFNFDRQVHTYALEATTDYTKYPFCKEVADRVSASAPREFKLIYIMRHPLRRIESHSRHAERTGREVGQFPSPRRSHSLDSGVSPVSIATSRYAQQIDQYSEYYDRGDLLLLTLEKLAREPHATIAKVCKFLNLRTLDIREVELKSNAGETHSPSYSMVRRLYPAWQSLKSIQTLRSAARATIPKFVRASISRQAKEWVGSHGRFRLNTEESNALIADLAPDLRRLRDRYGIDPYKEWGIAV